MRVHDYLSQSKLAILKYVLVGIVVLGLVGWNANLQRQLADDHEGKNHGNGESEHRTRDRRSVANSLQGQSMGGAMFVRWGRSECPDDSSELVYPGIVGASLKDETGGSAEYTCLTRDPMYAKYVDGVQGRSKIGGAEYQVPQNLFDTSNVPSGSLYEADAVCAVCRSLTHSSQVMIPGRNDCYQGWKKEYWGYLMTAGFNKKSQHSWVCVDDTPEGDVKGAKNDNDKSGYMYYVEGICGSLPCPNYVSGRELTCVVCTK